MMKQKMSKENPNIKDLLTHFENQADRMDREKETILNNRPDIGDLREDTLLDFFRRHLPERCPSIKGGFIFDQSGNRSKQIDIIITSDLRCSLNQIYTTRRENPLLVSKDAMLPYLLNQDSPGTP
jgi:hypothetical protein